MRKVAALLFFSTGIVKGTDSIFYRIFCCFFGIPLPSFVFTTAAKVVFSPKKRDFPPTIYFFIRRLQVIDNFSFWRQNSDGRQEHLFSSGDCRLWTSSDVSSRRQSSDWPMRGRDLIMWSEGKWEALKKIVCKGDKIDTYGRTLRLLDQSGPRADSVKSSCLKGFWEKIRNQSLKTLALIGRQI